MSQFAPGWYPDYVENDKVRYWDGQQWTQHTRAVAPVHHLYGTPPNGVAQRSRTGSAGQSTENAQSAPKNKRRARSWFTAVGATAASIAALVALSVWFLNSLPEVDSSAVTVAADDETATAPTDSKSPEPKKEKDESEAKEPQQEPQKTADEIWKDKGFEVAEPGNLYVPAMDTSEFTCGYAPCLYYQVYTVDGCPNGLYLEASVLQGGAVVGMSNDMVSGVRPGESAVLELEAYGHDSVQFRINDLSCY